MPENRGFRRLAPVMALLCVSTPCGLTQEPAAPPETPKPAPAAKVERSVFGSTEREQGGLIGTFYDLKQTQKLQVPNIHLCTGKKTAPFATLLRARTRLALRNGIRGVLQDFGGTTEEWCSMITQPLGVRL